MLEGCKWDYSMALYTGCTILCLITVGFFAPCVFDFCQYEHVGEVWHVALLVEYRVKITENHKINQLILVIDHHWELIPINSGLNPLYKNV
jgi:hypothetical protein